MQNAINSTTARMEEHLSKIALMGQFLTQTSKSATGHMLLIVRKQQRLRQQPPPQKKQQLL